MTITKWDFAASLGDTRLCAMADPPPFQAIVDLIHKDMKVLCCHPEPCDIAHDFERIIYCVKVDKELFDLFFNSRARYRAAYYQSPFEGLQANAEAIGTLAPTLISSNATKHQRPRAFIEESRLLSSVRRRVGEAKR
ncbi:MAG: hypothetical protein E6K65_00110 [Nitrospirae bacterium]|nr:MAG: hypothetical protein E6K65_00110 [Nitrospirota bacterium]